MGDIRGRRALVTGAGQGIGRAIAEALIEAECNVVVHYFSSSAGAEEVVAAAREVESPGGPDGPAQSGPPGRRTRCPARSRGVSALALGADLTREDDAKGLVSAALEFLGGLDILVNNTGDLVARRLLADIDRDHWDRVMDVNMTSMMLVTRSALPALKEAGQSSIVNIASLAGRKGGHSGSLAYATAKGAVLTWTRSLSAEVAAAGVRVNAVAPGLILGTRFHSTHTTDESARRTIEQIPLGRAGAPRDVARTVLFLASEYDGFITGATLDVNGGAYCA